MSLADEGAKLTAPPKLHTIRYEAPPLPTPVADGITVSVDHVNEDGEATPGELTHNEDGSITVNNVPKPKSSRIGKKNFNDNLAIGMDDTDLSVIASDLLESIGYDIVSRKEWEETAARGIDLLGLKIEESSGSVTGGGGNISKCKDTLLLEAVLRYQSNFRAEMLPADGPVKVRDDKVKTPGVPNAIPVPTPPASPMMGHNGGPPMGMPPAPPPMGMAPHPPMGMPPGQPPMGMAPHPPMGGPPGAPPGQPPMGMPPRPPMGMPPHPPMGGPPGAMGGMGASPAPPTPTPPPTLSRSELANALAKDFNNYLTVVDKAYYDDTDRMSFGQALFGVAFKKVYKDPLENRPISRFVMANHLVVNNGASSLHDAKRITHIIPSMSKVEMKRMVLAKAYRDVELDQPMSQLEGVDSKIAETQGTQNRNMRPEDNDYTVYECYCYLNLKGFEHKDDLPLPYRVTIEKESQQVLEIRRNWKQTDENYKPRRHFVKFSLFPGLGFYDYGFVHVLGNQTRVLSAIESLMVDSGMFANFPGGLIDKMAAKQETNQIRPGPGGFKPIDTGGRPIQQVAMPMPYKDVSPNLMALAEKLKTQGEKLASISELPMGEGRADVPVGTIVAMIEQSTKLMSAVHKRNHSSQGEEFELLKDCFAEDPTALTKLSETPSHNWEEAKEFQDVKLVPASDPNVSSGMMRIMRTQAMAQSAQQAPPGIVDPKKVLLRVWRALDIEDPEDLFMPPSPQGPQAPPPHMVDAQIKLAGIKQKAQTDQQNLQGKVSLQQMEMQDHEKDRQSQEAIEKDRIIVQSMKDQRQFQLGMSQQMQP